MNSNGGRKYVSASQVHSWLYCQRSFHLKYDLGLPQQGSSAMSKGKLFHERIAKSLVKNEEPFLPKKWLRFYKEITSRINFSDDILVEQKVEGDVDGHNVLGYVDVIDRGQGLIVDWKFGRKVGKYNVQGYLYRELVKKVYGLDCEVVFAFVPAFAIKPMYPADYEDGEETFQAFLERPPGCTFKFASGSNKCQRCGYYMYCMNPEVLNVLEGR